MLLQELFVHYGRNWVKVARAINCGSTSLQNWRKWGYIPIESQIRIESYTNGQFKADLNHAKPQKEQK